MFERNGRLERYRTGRRGWAEAGRAERLPKRRREHRRLGRDLLRSNSCFATPRAFFGIEISPREGHFIFLCSLFEVLVLFVVCFV